MKDIEYYEKAADEIGHLYFEKYKIKEANDRLSLPHFHESVEFVFVKKGRYFAHIAAEERALCEGEIAFVDSFAPHFYRSIGEAEVYAVVIERKIFSIDPFTERVFQRFPKILNKDFDVIMRFFESVDGRLFANAYTKSGFADMLVGLLLSFINIEERKENKNSHTIFNVLKYLNEHFCENITLASLSSRFAYAENYFSSLFNAFAGMTLREYLNRRRINEVLKIKAQFPERSLFSIATECGYTNEKTFYRAYAKYKNS